MRIIFKVAQNMHLPMTIKHSLFEMPELNTKVKNKYFNGFLQYIDRRFTSLRFIRMDLGDPLKKLLNTQIGDLLWLRGYFTQLIGQKEFKLEKKKKIKKKVEN